MVVSLERERNLDTPTGRRMPCDTRGTYRKDGQGMTEAETGVTQT